MQVPGYIKSVGPPGAFVVLARDAVGRVKLSHLADNFVEDPGTLFPPGMLVQGTVMSLADGRYACLTPNASRVLILRCKVRRAKREKPIARLISVFRGLLFMTWAACVLCYTSLIHQQMFLEREPGTLTCDICGCVHLQLRICLMCGCHRLPGGL